MKDFLERIEHYRAVYEPVDESEDCSFIKLVDVNRTVVAHGISGYFDGRILFFLSNMSIRPRPIWLTRHGESLYNTMCAWRGWYACAWAARLRLLPRPQRASAVTRTCPRAAPRTPATSRAS